jgi:hypothetical protein
MDRGANALAPSDTAGVEVVPPVEWPTVRKIGLAGAGLLTVAAALGLVASALADPAPAALQTARLLCVLVGSITVGAAVSMRPDMWQVWALGAGAAVLAVVGTPAHWDSFRLLFGVLAAVAGAWAVVLAAPPKYRLPAASALLLFHFTGIALATTTPPSGQYPAPWVTEQAFVRIFNPYLQFVYMRNAYHFYSPQPGAASVLVFLLKTETGTDPATGEKQYKTQWVVLPKRPGDVKDPLGLTYYRRLSLTEQLARGSPGLRAATFERSEMYQRRMIVAGPNAIPIHPTDDIEIQYQLPQPEVARFVLPSYASHVILEHTPDKATAAKTTVKVYRVQHNTMLVEEFTNSRNRPGAVTNPYSPLTYRPFFLGEFYADGTMVNPQEPMLYWLVPILPRTEGVPPGSTKRDYIDCMSIHALDTLNLSTNDVDDPRFKDRVFDWNQLR